jgi:broad specificity phosphatase PhoE
MVTKMQLIVTSASETQANQEGRVCGWLDNHLTLLNAVGRMQSATKGRSLSRIRFEAIYTSTLRRAIDTAELIKAQNEYKDSTPIIRANELREKSAGSIEGTATINGAELLKFSMSDEHGEKLLGFQQRIGNFMKKIFEKHVGIQRLKGVSTKGSPNKGHAVLFVCHEGVAQAIQSVEKGLPAYSIPSMQRIGHAETLTMELTSLIMRRQ